jgi:hypothetical protein
MNFFEKISEMLRLNATPVPVLPAWATYDTDRKRIDIVPADAYSDILSRYKEAGIFTEHAPNVYWMEVAFHTIKRVVSNAVAGSEFELWDRHILLDPECALLNFQKNRTTLLEQSEAARKGWIKHYKALSEKSQWI